ncbi:hypothetical protein V8C37DRAFT_139915 [Trichoderma ceciliae]
MPAMTFRPTLWRTSDSFLPSGAVEPRPNPTSNRKYRIGGDINMSDNDSGNDTGNRSGIGNVGGTGGSSSNARVTPAPIPSPSTVSFLAAIPPEYTTSLLGALDESHGLGPGTPSRPGLLSPFAPSHYPYGHGDAADPWSVPPFPSSPLLAERGLIVEDTVADVTAKCHCRLCSGGLPSMCLPQQLARQQASIRAAWETERMFIENSRARVEVLLREESKLTLNYHRRLWIAEKQQLEAVISGLRGQVLSLQDENRKLKNKTVSARSQRNEPIIHHGSFQANTPLLDGGPPSPMDNQQSCGADSCGSAHGLCSASRSPSCSTVADSDAAVPVSPQTSVPRSLPPGHGTSTIPTSALFLPDSPCLEVEAPSGIVSEPARSPKRPVSVVDVNEVDPRLEGISLRASAVRKTTFAETSEEEEGSPRGKRRRSLSHDYYIVTNLKKEEEEEQRLTMYAGHTPNQSPSLPLATTSGPSGGSTTPTALSLRSESNKRLKTESRTQTATATATAEMGESSRVSYPDLSHHLERVESACSSPSSCSSSSSFSSQKALLEATDDAPLRGPLMIKNIPAQDELFFAALNRKLKPISQGQDALPKAVQAPVAVPVPLSAVSGVPNSGVVGNRSTVPDNTNVSGTQSDTDEELDGVSIKMEPIFPVRTVGWDDDEDVPVKIERPPFPVKMEDSDDDSDSKPEEPELPIKFRSTSNFGAPFGRI